MRIHLGANSAGYAVARRLQEQLTGSGHDVLWHAAPEYDEGDDYPVYSVRVGQAVVEDEDAGRGGRGIVVGGDGAGETVTANKVNGGRAVPGLNPDYVRAARQHADANVLVLSADLSSSDDIDEVVGIFLATDFLADLDDARRIVNTAEYEASKTIEGWLIEH